MAPEVVATRVMKVFPRPIPRKHKTPPANFIKSLSDFGSTSAL